MQYTFNVSKDSAARSVNPAYTVDEDKNGRTGALSILSIPIMVNCHCSISEPCQCLFMPVGKKPKTHVTA